MLYRTTSEMKIPNAEGVDGSTKPRNILFWCVYVDRSDARIMRQLSGIIILPYTVSGQCHHRQHVDRFKNRLDSESAILISRIVTCRANSFRCYILESHPWLVPPPESRILLRSRNTFLFLSVICKNLDIMTCLLSYITNNISAGLCCIQWILWCPCLFLHSAAVRVLWSEQG